ncbi:MAG: sirohydrochlorin cobaltochelatase [Firmicutes bacterium]|nr:sirohydrochlorin cobaltochelatase [Bacillota bacterium]
MNQKGLLIVSFGTSFADAFESNIEPVERVISAAFTDRTMRRAFGSGKIIAKLKKRDGLHIDTVTEALEGFRKDGFTDILIQPTFIIPGIEYDRLLADAAPFRSVFDSLVIGKPFIDTMEDYEVLIKALPKAFMPAKKDAAIVLMGHGTAHFANAAYPTLEYMLHTMGYDNAYVATVEGYPDFLQVRRHLNEKGVKTVTLMPLMLVAGDHAKNDMAGEEEDSWKSQLEADGMKVTVILKGLGSLELVRRHFAEQAKKAVQDAGTAK